jgi:hypothetical protein
MLFAVDVPLSCTFAAQFDRYPISQPNFETSKLPMLDYLRLRHDSETYSRGKMRRWKTTDVLRIKQAHRICRVARMEFATMFNLRPQPLQQTGQAHAS